MINNKINHQYLIKLKANYSKILNLKKNQKK